MAVEIIDEGHNNTVILDPQFEKTSVGRIHLVGDNNRVIIGKPLVFGRLVVEVYNGSTISIGEKGAIGELWLTSVRGATIKIGRGLKVNGAVALRADEEAGITMGDNCLLAPSVKIWSSDMHSILDQNSQRRINQSKDILIEDHVWLCEEVKVLKGSIIRSNSVIGCNAVVTGEIPANCVAAGNPIQVKKTGINWSIDLI